MKSLRIKGLISVSNHVRRTCANPLSPADKKELRVTVDKALRNVEYLVTRHGVTVAHLPAPSRRAYQFLKSLDFRALESLPDKGADARPQRRVNVRGVKKFLDSVVAQLAEPSTTEKLAELYLSICETSAQVETIIQADSLEPRELTTVTRAARGWLAYFSVRQHYVTYVEAVVRAKSTFEAAIKNNSGFRLPVNIEFRPMSALYRIRGLGSETRAMLATPMISFDREIFCSMAQAAFYGSTKQPFMREAEGETYQAIRKEIESLGGLVSQPIGIHRDLNASFSRVVAEYFDRVLEQPRLTWSKTFTGRKFGHYDTARDIVMISSTLDSPDVPTFVLDCVMHHELLHKKLGVKWYNGRRTAHTPEFRKEERRFTRLGAADAILKNLANEH